MARGLVGEWVVLRGSEALRIRRGTEGHGARHRRARRGTDGHGGARTGTEGHGARKNQMCTQHLEPLYGLETKPKGRIQMFRQQCRTHMTKVPIILKSCASMSLFRFSAVWGTTEADLCK